MDTEPLRIGLIGYRGFGAFCTETFHRTEQGRVVAFAGRDAQAMAETALRYGVPKTYTDWRALVADPDVEMVHIVTPPDKHAEMAVAALEAGKHVLVEKPLATSEDGAQAILDAARRAGRVAGINYVMRYNPLYQAVARIAREGWLGGLTHVGFENYASDEGLGDAHWFWDKGQSGGIFVEHGVHFFDVIGDIVGAPARRVLGQTWERADGTGKEDRVQAIITYGNGIEASFYHAFNRPGALERQNAHFAFEKGHVTLDGWIPHTLHLSAIAGEGDLLGLRRLLPVNIVDDEDFPPPGRAVRGNGKEYRVTHRVHARERLGDPTPVYQQAVRDVLLDLAAAVRDPAHRPRVSAADGAASLRVALAAKRSAEMGRAVEIGREE
ncbi:MAG: Gfo/Idh/MocA family oxidoreductase [Armatimonadetes bacterium]|nr:Gfo/Idh/MocA family oxidoreductase [Armatimonadota bacterium]